MRAALRLPTCGTGARSPQNPRISTKDQAGIASRNGGRERCLHPRGAYQPAMTIGWFGRLYQPYLKDAHRCTHARSDWLSLSTAYSMLCTGTPSPSHHELGIGARMRGPHDRARLARDGGGGRQKVVRRSGHNGAHLEATLGFWRERFPGLHTHARSGQSLTTHVHGHAMQALSMEIIHEHWSCSVHGSMQGVPCGPMTRAHWDSMGGIVRVLQFQTSSTCFWGCQSYCQPLQHI